MSESNAEELCKIFFIRKAMNGVRHVFVLLSMAKRSWLRHLGVTLAYAVSLDATRWRQLSRTGAGGWLGWERRRWARCVWGGTRGTGDARPAGSSGAPPRHSAPCGSPEKRSTAPIHSHNQILLGKTHSTAPVRIRYFSPSTWTQTTWFCCWWDSSNTDSIDNVFTDLLFTDNKQAV